MSWRDIHDADVTVVAGSWSNAGYARKEQGICRPPVNESRSAEYLAFIIPPGIRCEISSIYNGNWRPFVTRKRTVIEKRDSYKRPYFVFRLDGYLLRIHRRFIKHELVSR